MVNTHLMIGLPTDDRKAGTGVPATLTCSEVAPLITPGTLVVNHWLLDLPLDLRIGGFQYDHHSRIYPASLSRQVHRSLTSDGWQFLRMRPLVHERAISWRAEKALCRALRKVLYKVRNENLNALQIVDVKVRKLLGCYWASLVAQARNVQISRRYDYGGCGQVFWPIAC
ncbi:MAG TPA: hypothetical protein VJQ50_16850 [Terriglobales bacterium]|nr:hypothetical protein [Terriglobales bacterium]